MKVICINDNWELQSGIRASGPKKGQILEPIDIKPFSMFGDYYLFDMWPKQWFTADYFRELSETTIEEILNEEVCA